MKYFLSLGILLALGCAAQKEAPSFSNSAPILTGGARNSRAQAGSPSFFNEKESPDSPSPEDKENLQAGKETKKLIREAELRIQTPKPETTEPGILKALENYGAYAEETQIYEHSRSYIIRVPEKSFQPLLEEFLELGKILYRSERTEDKTREYYDLEGRLETKQILRNVFLGYLQNAKSIEEILEVESRLAEVQREIDGAGTALKALGNLADFSTIHLNIQGPRALREPALGEQAAGLLASFGKYVSGVFLFFLGIILYGLPSLLILFLLYWLLLGKIGVLKKLWGLAAGRGKKP
jgi:hypothetical protein